MISIVPMRSQYSPVASDPEVTEDPLDKVVMTDAEEQFVVVPLVAGDGPHEVLAHHHQLSVRHDEAMSTSLWANERRVLGHVISIDQ